MEYAIIKDTFFGEGKSQYVYSLHNLNFIH